LGQDELVHPMTGSGEHRVGSIAGIDIRLHWSFWLLVAVLAFEGWMTGSGLGDAVLWLVLVFGSVLVHELAHALVGRRRGAEVVDIVLMPLGGATRTIRFPNRPGDELVMVLVGPLTSLALAGSAALLAAISDSPLLPIDVHHGGLLARITWLNLILGIFNLLPIFPMDGGRALHALLAFRWGTVRATLVAARIGMVLAVILGVGALVARNLWLVVIAWFLFDGARAEHSEAAAETTSAPAEGIT